MKEKKLTVAFITQDEPFYIPYYLDMILNKMGSEAEISKVYAVPPHLHKKGFVKTVQDFLSYFGPVVFLYMVMLRAFYHMSDTANRYLNINNRYHSAKLVCKKYGIAYEKIDNINLPVILGSLVHLSPDIIFSVACPQIFGKKIITIPSKGCLNIHSSLLPKYRGLNANFWALAKGERVTGVTIHYIKPGIDDGDILQQEEIKIDEKWSLHDLYMRVIETGSSMIANCIRIIYEDNIIVRKNDISRGSYYSFPSRKDVKEFRSRKKRFYKYY